MVKNTKGGGGAKKQASKHANVGDNREKVVAREGEEYGVVLEMKGGGECIVKLLNGEGEIKCKIGGKFRGRNKRSNYIEKGTKIIIGLRSWDRGRGDVIYVYNEEEVIDVEKIIVGGEKEEDEYGKLSFKEEDREEIKSMVKEVMIETEISIDDI